MGEAATSSTQLLYIRSTRITLATLEHHTNPMILQSQYPENCLVPVRRIEDNAWPTSTTSSSANARFQRLRATASSSTWGPPKCGCDTNQTSSGCGQRSSKALLNNPRPMSSRVFLTGRLLIACSGRSTDRYNERR